MRNQRNNDEKRLGHIQFLVIIFVLTMSYYGGTTLKSLHSGLFGFAMPVILIIFYSASFHSSLFSVKNIILFALSSFFVFISFLIVGGGVGSVLNNIACVVYVLVFYEIEINKEELYFFIKLLNVFHFLFFISIFVFGYSNGYIGVYNANTVAMQAVFDLVIFDLYPSRYKILYLFQNITSLFIILYTSSRTSLGAILIFWILLVLINKNKIHAGIMKVAYWFMAGAGLFVPIIYAGLYRNYDSPFVSKLVEFSIEHFNKNLFTGREYIWQTALDKMEGSMENVMLGIGSHYSEELAVDSNFHSSFFTVFICCGVVGYILIMWFLFRFFSRNIADNNKIILRSRGAYLVLMVLGMFESTLFTGHFAVLGYLILSIKVEENDLRKEEKT